MGRVAAALRALTGRGPRTSALLRAPEEPGVVEADPPSVVAAAEGAADAEPGAAAGADAAEVAEPFAEPAAGAAVPPTGEEAAARIDAARERLRSRIAAPVDEDPAEPLA